MKKLLLLLIFFSTCVCRGIPRAEEIPVNTIVDKAYTAAYYAGKDGKADVRMVITDRQGRERIREFTILRLDIKDGGDQKFYIYFKKPEDIIGMVFMVWKHSKGDDDRWLYLPALDLVRRIASSDKRSSFAGSDFLYEDISGRSITEDTHTLEETTAKHFKLKNIPKKEDDVEFAYYYLWIDKTSFLPVTAEYYDHEDVLIRKIEALDVADIQGHPTVVRSKATNVEAGSTTVTEFKNIRYDIGLTDNIFTERYLRRPPRTWIK